MKAARTDRGTSVMKSVSEGELGVEEEVKPAEPRGATRLKRTFTLPRNPFQSASSRMSRRRPKQQQQTHGDSRDANHGAPSAKENARNNARHADGGQPPFQQQQQQHQQQQIEENDRERHRRQEEEEEEEEEEEVRDNFTFIDLRAENSRRFRNFALLGREATFAIRPPPEGTDIVRWIENAFREIRTYALHSCEPNDYVGLSFESADLARGPAGLSFRPARDLTHEDIWQLVSSLAQSAGGFDIAENFTVRVFKVSVPAGRGRQSNRLTREDIAKRSILQINNTDNLCFPRSIVVARTYQERGQLRTGELQEKWGSVRHQRSSLQRKLAEELTKSAGITIPEEGCGIREIEQFQRILATENIAIMVYNFRTFGRGENPMYDGRSLLSSLGRETSCCLNIIYKV